MVNVLVVANLFAVTSLVTIYVLMFGRDSLQKYFEKGVIVIKQEETPMSIIPPSKILSTDRMSWNIKNI